MTEFLLREDAPARTRLIAKPNEKGHAMPFPESATKKVVRYRQPKAAGTRGITRACTQEQTQEYRNPKLILRHFSQLQRALALNLRPSTFLTTLTILRNPRPQQK